MRKRTAPLKLERINFCLTKEERAQLERHCREQRKTISETLRELIRAHAK